MVNPLKQLRKLAYFLVVVVVAAACGGGGGNKSSPETTAFFPAPAEEFVLVWSDEFDGDAVNLSNWEFQLGDGSDEGLDRWGNNEQQWYAAENATVADGMLTIEARAEELVVGFPYTSARMRSAQRFDFQYGRIEARIQAAGGQGLWNAFWMLPTDSPYGTWAASGEIDIIELVNPGTDDPVVQGAIHYGFQWPLNQIAYGQPEAEIASETGFHVYAVEWEGDELRWYVDDEHYMTLTAENYYNYYYAGQNEGYQQGEPGAPFDTDFHLLLNLAVGGNFPGNVDDADLPSSMVVDYVRVYRCDFNEPDGGGCNSNADRTLETPPAQAPFIDSFDLYVDAATPLTWRIAGEDVVRELAVNSFWDNDGALSFSEVAEDGRGMVIEVVTSNSGNVSINAVDGEPTSLFGMGNNPQFWLIAAGELKFDMYVSSDGTDPESSILIKMDSGFPALGQVELAVADLPMDEWFTMSVQINDLLANSGADPLDTENIISFFVLEPTGAANVRVDNIQIACGHPANNGCGILPPGGEVDGALQNVFINDVDPLWTNGIGAWDTIFGADYFDGASGNHVSWSITSSGDPEREEILAVSFSNSGANGLIYIQAATGIDMSTFAADGLLQFDLRLEAGSTHGITYKVDCIFPCTSGDQVLDVSGHTRGEWTTVEIPVASLISQGLDITRVNTGLVIFPTWDAQGGVNFDLDNVRWVVPETTGGGGGTPDLPVLANGLADAGWDTGVGAFDEQIGFGSCDGDGAGCPSVGWAVVNDAERGDVLEVTYAGPGLAGVFIQSSAGRDLTAYADGFISFDINVTDAGTNTTGFTAKADCIFPCTSGDQDIGIVGASGWETVTLPVAQLVAGGLDLTTVNTGLVIWPNAGEQTGVVFRLDNVVWTLGNAPAPVAGLTVFADQLEDQWEQWVCCGNASTAIQDAGAPYGAVAETAFSGTGGTVAGFLYGSDPDGPQALDVSAYTALEFDARVVSHPNTGSDVWLLKVESANAAQNFEVNLNTSVEGVSPVEGEWQHYTFNLADYPTVDWSTLQIIMLFPPWMAADGALIQVDNVVFTE